MREVLKGDPWQKQVDILESVRDNRQTAVRSCHGAGKSWTAGAAALWFLYAFPQSLVITTAPTDRQVRQILWQEIRTMHRRAGGRRTLPVGGVGRPLTKQLDVAEGWRAFGFSTRIPDNLQGLHAEHILVIVDEAAGVLAEIWDAISALLTSGHSRMLAIGNPTDTGGEFYKLFKDPGAAKIKIGYEDTPNFQDTDDDGQYAIVNPSLITPAWVEERRRKWGEDSPMFQARVLGNFPTASSDALIPLTLIEAAQERSLTPAEPVELGVDVARYGSDTTVQALRRGPVLRLVSVTAKEDTMETTGRVATTIRAEQPSAVKVDSDGLGAGVTDRLRELGFEVIEIHGGSAAMEPERFANARAEWYWGLRERFVSGDIDVEADDDDLANQLASLKYKVDSRGRIQIESKDEMKRRGLSSPDRADAACYAFAPAQGGSVWIEFMRGMKPDDDPAAEDELPGLRV